MELGGGKGILENDQVRLMEEYRGSYFLHLSGADKGSAILSGQALADAGTRFNGQGLTKADKLFHVQSEVFVLRKFHTHQNRFFILNLITLHKTPLSSTLI